MNKRQSGFTLIELISVIVILGILSAFAIPRFANLEGQARRAAIQGLGGAVRSAAALAHAVWLAEGAISGPTTISMEGQVVALDHGYPLNDQIELALQDGAIGTGGQFVGTGTDGQWTVRGASDTDACQVQYIAPTADNTSPNIIVHDEDCN